MNYIGSKLTLIDFLKTSIRETLTANGDNRPPQQLHFADLFAGTGIVAAAAKELGCNVTANDLQYYSYVLCRHLIAGGNGITHERAIRLCERLSASECTEGFIYRNYSLGGTRLHDQPRCYFSDYNAAKCDGMRMELERKWQMGKITLDEYFFLLASLLTSIDKYANTASVYGSFLKRLKKTAQREVVLTPMPIVTGNGKYQVYNCDAESLVNMLSGDILYLDPPYNARQYSSNYHMLETIARGDSPIIRGKTGVRTDQHKSRFCSSRHVFTAFENLIAAANFRYIFLSYNNEGLMPLDKIKDIMSRYGSYSVRMQSYRRFKADSDENRPHKDKVTTEYLHILVKNI
ncbi:DNA adenine methylase [Hydrogenoanaerobacterium sp.]|uniref:DNA adenine methylase n=1 Tax=Hydrogenoanaerobacterium sp. TaxID=2953763 RepID=UPI0028A19E84|nr:DNA adenine methylase [Hydrogenoanaerobacterium sp.]